MAVWDGLIPERDLEIYRRAGFSRQPVWDGSPALLIVDALWGFIGHRRVDVLDAISEYPTACGEAGWDGLERTEEVLRFFREAELPVVHVCGSAGTDSIYGATTRAERTRGTGTGKYEIPEQIQPVPGEPVVFKSKASGFFRTALDVLLHKRKVDTVLIAGSTTCGCVRATAVDAHSNGFETIVLSDAVWDRSPFSHAVSLFEMSMKYASAVPVDEAIAELGKHNGR